MYNRIVVGLAITASIIATLLFAYEQSLEHGFWGIVAVIGLAALAAVLLWSSRGRLSYRHLDPALDANHRVEGVERDRGFSTHLRPPERCSTCGQLVTPTYGLLARRR